jgi:hypothetical protein
LNGNHAASKVTAAHSTFLTLDTTDLTKLIGAAPSYALPNAKWFISNYGFATVFCRLAASAGGHHHARDRRALRPDLHGRGNRDLHGVAAVQRLAVRAGDDAVGRPIASFHAG